MKKIALLSYLLFVLLANNAFAAYLNEPDSAFIFAYSTTKNEGHNGLHFAWSVDRKSWRSIGPEYRFLGSDYGQWGREKRMLNPFLFRSTDGMWHCVWSLNEYDGTFAHAASTDLVLWYRQSYPVVMQNNDCTMPELSFNKNSGTFAVTWISTKAGSNQVFGIETKDFKSYSVTKPLTQASRVNTREKALVDGNTETGIIYKVSWNEIDKLIKSQQAAAFNRSLINENFTDDSVRFKGLKPVTANINVNFSQKKNISDLLFGIFFEDINYAADGGLYAELIENRGFEYSLADKKGQDPSWDAKKAWSVSGNNISFAIDTLMPVHPNTKHYAVLNINKPGDGFFNTGFNGIVLTKGDKYNFSVFVRNPDNKAKKLIIRLVGKNGKVYGETSLNTTSSSWKKIETVMVSNETVSDAQLEIIPQTAGSLALDMISLFPQKTFKGHKNGLRPDLAQTIADLHPRFIRFPGGCVAHGDGIANIYKWKNTIGPLETRKPQRNIWNYNQSGGLGYFEFFQFCEDIGALPLPVIAAGVPCQNSAVGGPGQQGGVPMEEMDSYIQDILDLIEWANGDAKSVWGKKRAEAGHPAPFNLKYIGIGNEDLITDIFEERYTKILKVLKEKYPEITVIGTVGPFNEGTDYVEGWNIASKLGIDIVDEHYYQSPGWFINNQDFYDKYDRSKSKVYLGEYASWGNTLYNALAEAAYLTSIERNGDVVSMASYAPLLAKEGFTQWHTDLIYFNNTEIKPSVNYYVQNLYGQNAGNTYIENIVKLSDNNDAVRKRVVSSVVRDSNNGDIIVKLVNLLPSEVNTQINLEGIDTVSSSAILNQLSGKPGERNLKPVTSTLTVSKNFSHSLPGYSFSVIRIKTK
jgi:alpha-L-arabinofuranosidase